MAITPSTYTTAAQDLLSCVCTSLDQLPDEVTGLHGCPCRACIVPGQPVADACGDDCTTPGPGQWPGQLTVNVARVYESDRKQFPRESSASDRRSVSVHDARGCLSPQVMALVLQVTMFRCAPGSTKDGCPPSCEDLAAAAAQVNADMFAVHRGILCCYAGTGPDTPTRRGREFVIGPAVSVGPQGGCVGFTQSVTLMLADCVVCPPEAP
jgi:hypothetical protein